MTNELFRAVQFQQSSVFALGSFSRRYGCGRPRCSATVASYSTPLRLGDDARSEAFVSASVNRINVLDCPHRLALEQFPGHNTHILSLIGQGEFTLTRSHGCAHILGHTISVHRISLSMPEAYADSAMIYHIEIYLFFLGYNLICQFYLGQRCV